MYVYAQVLKISFLRTSLLELQYSVNNIVHALYYFSHLAPGTDLVKFSFLACLGTFRVQPAMVARELVPTSMVVVRHEQQIVHVSEIKCDLHVFQHTP